MTGKPSIEQQIESHREVVEYLMGISDKWNTYESQIRYHEKAIDLLKAGIEFEKHRQGFLIKKRYIVAIRKNKWRVTGKGQWYFYKDINQLKEKYINNSQVRPRNEMTLASELNRQWDNYVAKLGQHQIIG